MTDEQRVAEIQERCSKMTYAESAGRILSHIEVHKFREPRAIKISEALDIAVNALLEKSALESRIAQLETDLSIASEQLIAANNHILSLEGLVGMYRQREAGEAYERIREKEGDVQHG